MRTHTVFVTLEDDAPVCTDEELANDLHGLVRDAVNVVGSTFTTVDFVVSIDATRPTDEFADPVQGPDGEWYWDRVPETLKGGV